MIIKFYINNTVWRFGGKKRSSHMGYYMYIVIVRLSPEETHCLLELCPGVHTHSDSIDSHIGDD